MAAPTAVQREAVGLVIVAVRPRLLRLRHGRLWPAGDERRQPVDVAFFRGRAALLGLARLIGLVLLLRERLRVARDVGLRLACAVGGFAASADRGLLVVAVVVIVVA